MSFSLGLDDFTDVLAEMKKAAADIEQESGLYPRLRNNDDYKAKEWEKIAGKYGENFSHLQDSAEKLAESETDRATYQAMEALIHNLNTMNSGRERRIRSRPSTTEPTPPPRAAWSSRT